MEISAAELTLYKVILTYRQVELTKAQFDTLTENPTVNYANTSKPKQKSGYQGKYPYCKKK